MPRGKNYYAVAVGRKRGIYMTWDEAKAQVEGYKNHKHEGFYALSEARDFLNRNPPIAHPPSASSSSSSSSYISSPQPGEAQYYDDGDVVSRQRCQQPGPPSTVPGLVSQSNSPTSDGDDGTASVSQTLENLRLSGPERKNFSTDSSKERSAAAHPRPCTARDDADGASSALGPAQTAQQTGGKAINGDQPKSRGSRGRGRRRGRDIGWVRGQGYLPVSVGKLDLTVQVNTDGGSRTKSNCSSSGTPF